MAIILAIGSLTFAALSIWSSMCMSKALKAALTENERLHQQLRHSKPKCKEEHGYGSDWWKLGQKPEWSGE